MRSLLSRFDAWVDEGPFTARDLGLARIIYATLLLVTTPALRSTSDMPPVTWRPPFGPLRLLDEPPSKAATTTIAVVLSVGLVMLLLGVFTTWASLAVGVAYLLNDGIGNSFGFVAHYILVAVVPLTCCWAGWGRRYSIDALLRRGRNARTDENLPQWPLRLLAVCIGAGFLTAAVPKILAGWLDPSTQAAYGHIVKGTLTRGPQNLAQRAADFHAPLLWELADWATVALEASVILVAVLSWRWFQGVLVALMSFHLGIAFTLNIAFAANVLTYVPFVLWSRHLLRPEGEQSEPLVRPPRLLVAAITAPAIAVLTAVSLRFIETYQPSTNFGIRAGVIVVCFAVSLVLCAHNAQLAVRRRRPPTSSSG
jgi:hypothetical protein